MTAPTPQPRVVLVGELNPYGADPRYALYDEPTRSAGGRLRRLVLGLPRRVYFGPDIEHGNLCTGRWSAPKARAQARRVLEQRPDAVIVMLGRKAASAFGRADLEPFSRDGALVSLPHPSGLCRVWDTPGAFQRAREVLTEVCPDIPWGSLGVARG